MITTTVDISGLERHFKRLEGLAIDRIDEGFTRLQGTAEQLARQLIDVQIYDTPPRGGTTGRASSREASTPSSAAWVATRGNS